MNIKKLLYREEMNIKKLFRKSYRDTKKQLKYNYRIGKLLNKHFPEEGFMFVKIGYGNKYIISTKDLNKALEIRHELKNILKQKNWTFESWSPYGDKAMFQWGFLKDNLVVIWYETTIDNVPEGLLKPTCKFIKQTIDNYTLICSKE